jgi:hypothetical protein
MSETRKIAAILSADVVGHSRLAGADEDRTLARLRARDRLSTAEGDRPRTSRGRKRKPDSETAQFFDSLLVKIRKMPYIVRAVRTERRTGEARLRDKENGR